MAVLGANMTLLLEFFMLQPFGQPHFGTFDVYGGSKWVEPDPPASPHRHSKDRPVECGADVSAFGSANLQEMVEVEETMLQTNFWS